MGPTLESSAEKALGRDEVLRIYRMAATLARKVTQVGIENREAASSACWHAIQCIRNIYVRLGDIVDTVAIEQERFVVLRIKTSEELRATGRIVVAPSGAYAYCFERSGSEQMGHGEGTLGLVFFPLGQVETFESFGWSRRVVKNRGVRMKCNPYEGQCYAIRERRSMSDGTSEASSGQAVYIYTDYNVPTTGRCMARPVYLKNPGSKQKRVVVQITKPKHRKKCEPMETKPKTVSVPGNGKVFLGYNAVNCSSSPHSVECRDVSYRL